MVSARKSQSAFIAHCFPMPCCFTGGITIALDTNDTIKQYKLDLWVRYLSKSDAELNQILLDNVRKAAATPNRELARLQLIAAESDVCSKLLSERKEERKKLEALEVEWKQNLPKMQEQAILNLKTAASPNGQLVAAILEEESGLTAESIHGWCEELAALSPEEMNDLLSGLEAETIIEKRDGGAYYLVNICTEDLFQPDKFERAMSYRKENVGRGSKFDRFDRCPNGNAHVDEIIDVIFDFLNSSGSAQTVYSLVKALSRAGINIDFEHKIHSDLRKICADGVLACYNEEAVKEQHLYYYPMLGFKASKKS